MNNEASLTHRVAARINRLMFRAMHFEVEHIMISCWGNAEVHSSLGFLISFSASLVLGVGGE